MNKTLYAAALLLAATTVEANQCSLAFAVGSYTNQGWLPTSAGAGVVVATLDGNSFKEAKVMGRPITGDNPSYVAYNDEKLYCANENSWATVTRITDLTTSDNENTGAGGATFVTAFNEGNTERVLVANYGGAFSSLRRGANGWLPTTTHRVPENLATGGQGWEQQQPHPHMALPIGGDDVIVPDLGTDRVWLFTAGADGKITVKDEAKLQTRDGPRHAAYNPSTRSIYVVNELSLSVVRLQVDGCAGSGLGVCERETLVTGANGATAAAIRLSKDGKFLYASVRYPGTTDGKIVGFSLMSNGAISSKIGEWSSQGVHPRDFFLVEASAGCPSYLAIVNRDSNNLVLVDRDVHTGVAEVVAHTMVVMTPTSVVQIPRESKFTGGNGPVSTMAPPRRTDAPSTGGACSKTLRKWHNCHGKSNCCARGLKCVEYHEYYSQCQPH